MNNIKEFEDLYVKIEEDAKKKSRKDTMWKRYRDLMYKRISPYTDNYEFIDFCMEQRNSKAHDSKNRKYIYITDSCIEKLRKIVNEIENPATVESKCITNLFEKNINDNVMETMNKMQEENYTHIPIYKNGNLVGIFSEYALFNYLYNKNKIEIDDNTTFEQIEQCINLEYSKENVIFVREKALYNDVIKKFIDDYEKKKKLNCIFVTPNGTKKEHITGIITAWDIIGKDF